MTILKPTLLRLGIELYGIQLLTKVEELQAFREQIATEVVRDEDSIIIDQERIALHPMPEKFSFTIDYPIFDIGVTRFVDILMMAIECTNLHTAPGYRISYQLHITYDQDSGKDAFAYLAERLFPNSVLNEENHTLMAASGQLALSVTDDSFWHMQIEPRFRDVSTTVVFLGASWNETIEILPTHDQLMTSIKTVHNKVIALANRLDKLE